MAAHMTVIHLTPKNFETIALMTDGLRVSQVEQLYRDRGNNYAIARDYMTAGGEQYGTWTEVNLNYLRDHFEFDEVNIFTRYVKATRKPYEARDEQ